VQGRGEAALIDLDIDQAIASSPIHCPSPNKKTADRSRSAVALIQIKLVKKLNHSLQHSVKHCVMEQADTISRVHASTGL
jgi:hypothetical protein